MKNKIKNILTNKLFKDSFVYVIADVINKGIPFLLLPVLTHYLTPEDYGILATFNSFVGLVGVFVGLSIHGVVTVNFFKYKKAKFSEFVGNVFILLLISTIFILFVLFIFQDIIYKKIGINYKWQIMAVFLSFLSFIIMINLSIWLATQKSKKYGSFQIFETILKIGFSLFFVIILDLNWQGRILGIILGTAIVAIYSIANLYNKKYITFVYNIEYIKDALKFGIPLIPHQLSFWLRSGAIVFILSTLVGATETGLYSVGAQFVIPLSVLSIAFNNAWVPFLYKKLSNNPSIKEKEKIVKFTYLYFIGIIILAVLLAILSPYIIGFLLDKKFKTSYIFTIYLAFAAAFQGMYLMVVNYIFYMKKNKYLAYITFSVSLLNILLAYILIGKNDAIGAVQAKLIVAIINFLLIWFFSNKVYPMPWNLLKTRQI